MREEEFTEVRFGWLNLGPYICSEFTLSARADILHPQQTLAPHAPSHRWQQAAGNYLPKIPRHPSAPRKMLVARRTQGKAQAGATRATRAHMGTPFNLWLITTGDRSDK
jgi:hypothetical protein